MVEVQSQLFDKNEHEPLVDLSWDETEAIKLIQRIVENIESQFSSETFWPEHPEDSDWTPGVPMTSLYWGASSNIWALRFLSDRKVVQLQRDFTKYLESVYQLYLKKPDSDVVAPGYLIGRAGIALLGYKFDRSSIWEGRVREAVVETIARPENELMWASPGAIICAKKMFEWTGNPEWVDSIKKGSDHLFDQWHFESSIDSWIWMQDLYGKKKCLLGAVHGAAGNVFSLLTAFEFLDKSKQALLLQRTSDLFHKTVIKNNGFVNWMPSTSSTNALVQFCHGAPGVIVSLGDYPISISNDLDCDLVAAGELIWHAGPLVNKFGLCHGNAGNSFAFLKLFKRTGDSMWLERAKAFALHAGHQSQNQFEIHGRRRPGLLTGDLGLALNLWSCIHEKSDFPLFDFI